MDTTFPPNHTYNFHHTPVLSLLVMGPTEERLSFSEVVACQIVFAVAVLLEVEVDAAVEASRLGPSRCA